MVDSSVIANNVLPDAHAQAKVASAKSSSAFVAHLRSYPVLDAAVSYTSSISLVRKSADLAKPYVTKVSEIVHPAIDKAAPIISRFDKLGDDTLTAVDKFVPALKSTQPPDVNATVNKSVESVRSTTHLYTEAAKSKVNGTLVEPTRAVVGRAKARTVAVYDSKGRPFIRAKLDPYLAPLNSRLASLINAYLPPALTANEISANAEPHKTELGNLFLIGTDAIGRVNSVVENKVASTRAHGRDTVAYVLALPQSAKSHVVAVWQDKKATSNADDLKDKPITSSFYLSLYTGKTLASEAVSYAESFAHARVDQIRDLAASLTGSTKAAVASATSKISSSSPLPTNAVPDQLAPSA
ncbi:hypothetical protein V1514DRAFT_333419 [Lipomyces japonicus]|uniref:uncharacterized protein n=1 Tax=Lipomyces japonicus TaxID=56871 RepID=UPI0034CEE376